MILHSRSKYFDTSYSLDGRTSFSSRQSVSPAYFKRNDIKFRSNHSFSCSSKRSNSMQRISSGFPGRKNVLMGIASQESGRKEKCTKLILRGANNGRNRTTPYRGSNVCDMYSIVAFNLLPLNQTRIQSSSLRGRAKSRSEYECNFIPTSV